MGYSGENRTVEEGLEAEGRTQRRKEKKREGKMGKDDEERKTEARRERTEGCSESEREGGRRDSFICRLKGLICLL